ncbi:uncharacterized protein LOC127005204 [Eriocheir sinensis]|uniref:uncharacterized protein LOC127005204 n=1 Tax=Eriocheir sinensis TaxID=95602 RepID=UPI0021C8571C|nr:uncharacterized protein LOC127005204 [Eriocheir sinensis]
MSSNISRSKSRSRRINSSSGAAAVLAGAVAVTSAGSLQGAAFAAFFILTRKIAPVIKGEPKKVYIPYVPPGPFVPPDHPLVDAVAPETEVHGMEMEKEQEMMEEPEEEQEMMEEPEEHGMMEEPGGEYGMMEGPGGEHGMMEGPGGEHGMMEGPGREHGMMEGPGGEHGMMEGPGVEHGNGGIPPEHGNGMHANGNGFLEHGNDLHGDDNGIFGHGPGPQEVSSYSFLKKRSLPDFHEDMSLDYLYQESLPAAIPDVGGPEEMVRTAAFHVDTTGCSLKLLCHLHEVPHAAITPEEAVLVMLFNNPASQEPQDCMQDFPDCPLSAKELRVLLQQI